MDMKRYFRGVRFIDREGDIKFLLKWFHTIPNLILWLYGPKSSGKTTLIEYVIEEELLGDSKALSSSGLMSNFGVHYMNLRRYLISNYANFEVDPNVKTKNEVF